MIINGHWRTEKLRDISPNGNAISQKVEDYIKTWESRCYSNDIPDEVPTEVTKQGLAPSYKAVAMAILLNRYSLLGIYANPVYISELSSEPNLFK